MRKHLRELVFDLTTINIIYEMFKLKDCSIIRQPEWFYFVQLGKKHQTERSELFIRLIDGKHVTIFGRTYCHDGDYDIKVTDKTYKIDFIDFVLRIYTPEEVYIKLLKLQLEFV